MTKVTPYFLSKEDELLAELSHLQDDYDTLTDKLMDVMEEMRDIETELSILRGGF